MFVTQPLNELAKLALIASDASYFTATLSAPRMLAPLQDTPAYNILPRYAIEQGFEKQFERRNDAIGFKFVAYKNTATNEVIVAFGGTDGADPVDWTGNTQLGWNQWLLGREQVFSDLRLMIDSDTKVHFTGQSMGGALAQYAAYEWVQTKLTVTSPLDPEFLANFDKSNVSLTTFNALGGLKGLVDNLPTSGIQHATYDPTVLQGLGLSGHFYVTNDLVSRLGGGHVGGDTFLLDFKSDIINPLTGKPYAYGLVDAHRIETGFYANLRPGPLLEFQMSPGASSIDYLNVDSMQEYAALYGNLLNNKELSLVESRFRLVAAVTAGLTIGSPSSVNTLTQALLTSLHDSGDLSESWFQKLQEINWGAIFIPTRPVTGAVSILSTLGAVFTDAVQETANEISAIFQAIGEYASAGSRPDITVTPPTSIDVSSLQLQFDFLIASMGAAPHLAELTASLPSGLDPEALAAQMLDGGANWLPSTLAFVRAQANATGQTPAQLAEMTTQLVTAINHRIDALQDVTLEEKGQLVAQLNSFTQDTAQGFAKAYSEFLQGVAESFDLGRVLSFLDINFIDQAYAAELDDRRLSSPIRAALEEARSIVQQAGQTVVVQEGYGSNPFQTAGFDPNTAAAPTIALNEAGSGTFTINLPYAAAAGGQQLQLTLVGPHASDVILLTGNGELAGQDGTFGVMIPEGHRQLTVGIRAGKEISSDVTLTLSATFLSNSGQATHNGAVEASIDLAKTIDRPTGQLLNVIYDQTIYGTMDGITNSSNDVVIGGTGRNVMFVGGGQDALYGMDGDDLLVDYLYGQGEDDYLDGGAENDYVVGGVGNEIIMGGEGNDFLLGSSVDWQLDISGQDYLEGGSGNDYLWGGAANDTLIGGADQDTLRGDNLPGDIPTATIMDLGEYVLNPPPSPSMVVMNAMGGSDFLDGGEGDDLLQGDAGADILIGGPGADLLYGDNRDEFMVNEGDDSLDGGDGDDQLFAAGGDDFLSGGAGIDQLYGDQGDDILDGGDGADTIVGGDGADVLFGGTENDLLLGEGLNNPVEASNAGGADFLDGGAGDDELQGGVDDDSLFGGSGADRLFGQEGDDNLLGDEGNDEIQGGSGQDVLQGDAGDDWLFGQEDNDVLSGDSGNDLVNGGLGNDELDGGEGIDDMQGREGDDFLLGGGGNDFLYGDGPDPTILNLVGGNDLLDGEEGDDQLYGGAGQDRLFGGHGADQLIGDVGNDELYGEDGNDLMFGDTEFFPDQTGEDTLDGGDGNDVLQGGGGDDQLMGGAGDDVLFGELYNNATTGAGNDVLEGGTGNDNLNGGGGSDTYVFHLGDGVDAITEMAGEGNRLVFGEGINSEAVTLSVDTGDTLVMRVGNGGDAVRITGFGFNSAGGTHPIDHIEFGDGTVLTDTQLLARGLSMSVPANGGTLLGTVFADHMQGSSSNDVLWGREGNDVLNGNEGGDELRGDDGDDVLDGGAGNDRLHGGLGANVLRGGAGDDVLESGGTGDQLFGGAGNDIYRLWSTLPIIAEETNAGVDTIHLAPTTSLTFHTPDHIENVQIQDDFYLDPAIQVDLVGNSLNNQLSGSHQIDGGEGNDVLVGIGDNTFVFDRGYGQDIVRTGMQVYEETGFDQVHFLSGITVADVIVENHANDLVLTISGSTDQLTVESYFASPSNTVDQFVFTDGMVWTADDINNRVRVFVGSEADDSFYGSLGDDAIRGLGGNDQIRASLGNDILDGGIGNDFLEGYSGDDTYVFGRGYGYDAIDEQGDSDDVDTLQLMDGIEPGDITLQAMPDNSTTVMLKVNGTNDELSLSGFFMDQASRVDRIAFADGTIWDYNAMLARVEGMTMTGTEESDYLYASVANDILSGFEGDDSLYGFGGNDMLLGGTGQDELNGGTGSDTLDGGLGPDTMIGGSGNDLYMVDDVGDAVTEQPGQGTDTVQSTVTYTLGTNLEHLTLTGGSAINGTGNAGNNTLTGNNAGNVLSGGAGNDTYVVGVGDTVVEQTGGGTDTVQSSLSWTLNSNVENLTLTGNQSIDGTGNTLDNIILGNSADNFLNGMQGKDRMTGGQGNDSYVVDNTGDVVTENPNEGLDTILSSISYTLGSNMENLTLTGTGAINGTGNSLNNVLIGNSAANRLTGGAGSDTYVIAAGDTVIESSGGGTDTVQSSVTHTLAANVENLTLTGTAAINGTGNSLNNALTGNNAANVLSGGAGNDTYVVSTGDTVTEQSNAGTDMVQSSVTWTLGANLENLTLTGTAAVNGTGNTLNNRLEGNSANNTLTGLGGNDTYLYSRGGGQDKVIDNSGTADRLLFGADIDPLDLVLSRQANDLRLAVHGTDDQVTVQNWFGGATNQMEIIQAGSGEELVNTKVDQLLQAMAAFTQQAGLTWDQAIDQRPQDVQNILAASWQ